MALKNFGMHRHLSLRSFRSSPTNARHFSACALCSLPETSEHLAHLTRTGEVHMVSMPSPVPSEANQGATHKPPTHRVAIARALVRFSNPKPIQLISSASTQKGDVLAVARIAGIMAAKKTSELIPLCHNIPIGGVRMDIEIVGSADEAMAGKVYGEGFEQSDIQSAHASPADWGTVEAAASLGLSSMDWRGIDHGAVVITARVHTYGQTGVEMEALTAASVAGLTVYDMCKGVDRGMRMEAVRVVLKEGGRSGTWREGENGAVGSVETRSIVRDDMVSE